MARRGVRLGLEGFWGDLGGQIGCARVVIGIVGGQIGCAGVNLDLRVLHGAGSG